ncbi:MAG: NAD-dependent deacylase, partial [Anaerolineales bacterium]|nr:NAD-dependent deacylase [Anaerolineales bacterium]
AQHIVVLSGAGTSAESGVPTFREAQTGLWAQYDPTELATPQAFRRNPQLVWDWYAWRRELITRAEPNAGHYALAAVARHVPKFTLITQNVDSLHQQAGSEDVIELHGNIMRIKCFDCGRLVTAIEETAVTPPRCPHCNGYLRPDVVWFGESLPQAALQRAFIAAHNCDLFFAIGTSALVQPAASLPVEAIQNNKTAVEINPQSTPLTRHMTFVLKGASGKILPNLVKATWG